MDKLDLFMKIYVTVIMYSSFILISVSWIGSIIAAIFLRKKFPDLWTRLGRPNHWIYGNITTITWTLGEGTNLDSHFFTFLDKNKFHDTEDPIFIDCCKLLRIGWLAGFFVFLLLFLTVLRSCQ